MTEKRKRGRPPGSGRKKEVISPLNPDEVALSNKGVMVVKDPILAASLARAPQCESAKDETSFPANWDSLSKITKLQWLTEHRK